MTEIVDSLTRLRDFLGRPDTPDAAKVVIAQIQIRSVLRALENPGPPEPRHAGELAGELISKLARNLD